MSRSHEDWMDLALDLARRAEPTGNTPVASLIVLEGEEIGRGLNEATTRMDPTIHAETAAIQDACRRRKSLMLTGATLYSTMESCPMCCWAIFAVDIEHVVLGARAVDLNRTDMGSYSMEKMAALTNRPLKLTTGVRHMECVGLRKAWTARTGRQA